LLIIALSLLFALVCANVHVSVDVSVGDSSHHNKGPMTHNFDGPNHRLMSTPEESDNYSIEDSDHVAHDIALQELQQEHAKNAPEEPEVSGGYGSCKAHGLTGTCTSSCSGGFTQAGLCPGPSSVRCCLPSKACSSGGRSGKCQVGCGNTAVAGICPGDSSVTCCLTGSAPKPTGGDCGQNVLNRANEWVSARLQYCQSANGARDYDSACSTYCHRTSNPAWDPYRSDCSGLASWSWGLPAPGLTTLGFAPFSNSYTYAIQASSLRAGDAVNNADHIMIFKQWVTQNSEAEFYEEPGCSSNPPHARLTTTSVRVSGSSIFVSENGMTFTAIRRNHC